MAEVKTLRVLWVTERFPPERGGAAVSAGRQVRALAPHVGRLDVVRLVDRLGPGRVEAVDDAGFTVHEVGRASSADESLQLLAQTCTNLLSAHRHDLVHGFYAVPAGQVAVLCARERGLPSVVSLRGNDVDRGAFSGGRLAPLLWTLTHASALVGVTRALLARVAALTGRTDGLHFVPNSVDAEVFRPDAAGPLPAALQGVPRPFIGFAGELRLKKGLPLLLDLAERLDGRGTVVAIGGARHDARAEVDRWRREHPGAVKALVELPYERDEVRLAALFAAMDLFVFPSLWEGLPNAALEAMACGRPVLATAVGGLTDLVRHGENGWLIEPARLDAVGSAARRHVMESFGVDAEREAILSVWRAVTA